ncbi:hypothetical protein [Ornithinimicrobium kibberense]
MTCGFVTLHAHHAVNGDRSRTGPRTPRTRSGSTTRRTSRVPGWRC